MLAELQTAHATTVQRSTELAAKVAELQEQLQQRTEMPGSQTAHEREAGLEATIARLTDDLASQIARVQELEHAAQIETAATEENVRHIFEARVSHCSR